MRRPEPEIEPNAPDWSEEPPSDVLLALGLLHLLAFLRPAGVPADAERGRGE